MGIDVQALRSQAANGGSSFYWKGGMGDMAMPIVFEAGLPDPTTFPADDLARLLGDVLRTDADGLQYGTPFDGDLSWGYVGLRDAIAMRTVARDGIDIDRASIMLTAGGVMGISLAARAFLDPGDHAVVEAPTWEHILRDVEAAGAVATGLPLDDDGMRIDLLEEHIAALEARGERLKLVYTIATFNVPTAICLSLERRRRLLALAAEHGFVIVEDNVYGDLRYDGDAIPSLLALDEAGVVLRIDSFSKILMPGLRIGWVTGNPDLLDALSRVRRDLGVSQLVARALARYLDEGLLGPHLGRVVDLYRTKRDACLAALDEHCAPNMTWNRPAGGYFLWLELADDIDAKSVQRSTLADGVMCRPGERFFGEPDLGAQRLRLAFTAAPVADLQRAIAVLGQAAGSAHR